MKKEGFYNSSYGALIRLLDNNNECYISSTCLTDIYYIVRKLTNKENALSAVSSLIGLCTVCDVGKKEVLIALYSNINDYEDAVVEATAYRNNCDYILTRDEKHFKNSKIAIITPKEINKKMKINI